MNAGARLHRRALCMAAIVLALVACHASRDRSAEICRTVVAPPCVRLVDLVAELRAHPDRAAKEWGFAAGRTFGVAGRYRRSWGMSGDRMIEIEDERGNVARCATGPVDARWSSETFLVLEAKGASLVEEEPPRLDLGFCTLVRAE